LRFEKLDSHFLAGRARNPQTGLRAGFGRIPHRSDASQGGVTPLGVEQCVAHGLEGSDSHQVPRVFQRPVAVQANPGNERIGHKPEDVHHFPRTIR